VNILKGITVQQFEGVNGPVKNQFKIITPDGVIFQSYDSIIAIKLNNPEKIILDVNNWDFSPTTGKYRNMFLGETKPETERKIKSGIYLLQNLN
jgi:hypothetical protein